MFVIKVTWEGVEVVESTWRLVSRVVHDAPAVLRKELKAQRLKAECTRALVQCMGYVYDHIVIWGGIQYSELLML